MKLMFFFSFDMEQTIMHDKEDEEINTFEIYRFPEGFIVSALFIKYKSSFKVELLNVAAQCLKCNARNWMKKFDVY